MFRYLIILFVLVGCSETKSKQGQVKLFKRMGASTETANCLVKNFNFTKKQKDAYIQKNLCLPKYGKKCIKGRDITVYEFTEHCNNKCGPVLLIDWFHKVAGLNDDPVLFEKVKIKRKGQKDFKDRGKRLND